MSFYTSPSFFILLAVAVAIAAILGFAGKNLRRWGAFVSLVFLALLFSDSFAAMGAFLFFMAVSATSEFMVLKSWQKGEKSMPKYYLGLALTLMPLVVCKVAAVFDQNLLGFIGISYVTFRAVQVIIETRDGLIEDMSLFDYLYFVSFFTCITSGPIDRSRRFVEDAHTTYTRSEYADLLSRGILLIFVGAVYQLAISSILLSFYTPSALNFEHGAVFALLAAVKDAWAYGLYLFFDFAGYSMMAIGASYCLGIRTPRNFRAPFAALDIKDFWNRWHMTLSFWLRDFIFMRFAQAATKHKWIADRCYRSCCGYLINMFVMGCWHGLTVDYICYGLYHGLLLAGTEIFQKKCPLYKKYKNDLWFKLLSWAVTINLVMLGMSIFSGQMHIIVAGLLFAN